MTSKVIVSVLFICDSQRHWINLSRAICIANTGKWFRRVPMPGIPNLEQISPAHTVRERLGFYHHALPRISMTTLRLLSKVTYFKPMCVCWILLYGLGENPVRWWIYVHNWYRLLPVWGVIRLHYERMWPAALKESLGTFNRGLWKTRSEITGAKS